MTFDSVKDDGLERETSSTGGMRETESGRQSVDLIPEYCIYRLGEHYKNGSIKYAPRNWEKGLPLSRYLASLKRHLIALEMGDPSEDHEMAIAWNIFGYTWTRRMIEIGRLPKELNDSGDRQHTNFLMVHQDNE